MIVQKHVRLTYPAHLLNQPLIYNLIKRFDLVTNILKAQVMTDTGWLEVIVSGEADKIQQGLDWITSQGVQVEMIENTEGK
jgi:ABC-type methionine transport system ATPase subunit